ncbi:LysR substrate-binding domain-containing protein [Lichenihabitans sp. Uapishka_5]|uniref:LysR substrate-binding domain-containing protein n=1 Tax=Lichenihabitans sp. Uapishka_5 TaxID=3037302 RepID=UPI0029E7CF98|nr:LysR substrate-binding domain-containing protein [Lichenihabitans sp. Uapishka_5]MDX7950080.1 LysR substrate-binding domain-containing protein [Lichenihabitans sp. Uapishka_5]
MQLLVALGEQGALNRAAESLGLSQPAASKLLIDLETAMKQPLFDRVGRGLVPNLYGEILMRRASVVVSELDGARDEFNAMQDGRHGRVAIGSIDAPIALLLADVVAALQDSHPRIDIEVRTGSSGRLLDQLFNGHLDLMVGRPLAHVDRSLFSYREIDRESLALVARVGHPLATRPPPSVAELRRQTWILQARGSTLRQRVDALFWEAGLGPPEHIVNTDSLLMTLAYLARTDAMTIISEPVALQQASFGQVVVIPTRFDLTLSGYGLILPTQRPVPPAVTTVVKALHQHLDARSSAA